MRTVLLTSFLLACQPVASQTRCEEVSSEPLADEDERLGTTAAAVFALAGDARPVTVSYGSPVGGSSPLEHVFTRRGAARHVEYRFVQGDTDIFLECLPELRVPVSITLRSDDRKLDESFDTELVATEPGSSAWQVLHVPRGTLRAHDFDHDVWTAYDDELQLDGAVGPGGRTGTAIVTLCDGDDDESACTPADAFSWGPAEE